MANAEAGRVDRCLGNLVVGVVDAGREFDTAVEFRVGKRVVGRVRLAGGEPGADAPTPDRARRFQTRLAVDGRASVTAWLQPSGVELRNSPFVVEPPQDQPLATDEVSDVPIVVAKRLALPPEAEVAIFVTHTRTGALKPHVEPYLRALVKEGISVVLLVAADRPAVIPPSILALACGVLVRRNSGYDFAAWAHCLKRHPELYGARLLYLLNDSLFGPSTQEAFAGVIERVRRSTADLVGLTSNMEYSWHLQSFFLALKPRLLASQALRDFFGQVKTIEDKDEVVRAYELGFAPEMQAAGFRVEALFSGDVAGNPTLKAWRRLLTRGFPFVKVLLLRGAHTNIDTTGWREALERAGFDMDLAESTIEAAVEQLPQDPDDRLLAHPAPDEAGFCGTPRVAYVRGGGAGAFRTNEARRMVAALRRTGVQLKACRAPLSGRDPAGSAEDDVVFSDYVAPPDIVIYDLQAPQPDGLVPLLGARIQVAVLRSVEGPCDVPADMDGLWVAERRDLAGARRRCPGSVELMPRALPSSQECDELDVEALSRFMAQSFTRLTQRKRPAIRPLVRDLGPGVPVDQLDLGALVEIVFTGADDAGDPAAQTSPDPDGRSPWLLLAPRDVVLHPQIKRLLTAAISEHPDVDIFYGDDVAIGEGPLDRCLRLKPEFDRTLLSACDYIGEALLIRASTFASLDGLEGSLDTAATAHLLMRASLAGVRIARIPHVLSGVRGLRRRAKPEDHARMLRRLPGFETCELASGLAPGTLRVRRAVPAGVQITVAVLSERPVGEGQGAEVTERFLDAIEPIARRFPGLEVLLESRPDTAREAAQSDRWPFLIRYVDRPDGCAGGMAGWGERANALWRRSASPYVLFLDPTLAPVGDEWLQDMLSHAVDPGVALVGGRVTGWDGRSRHAGVASSGGAPDEAGADRLDDGETYQNWGLASREWSMLSPAALLARRSALLEVGGFDEGLGAPTAGWDLCLKLGVCGGRMVSTPHAEFLSSAGSSSDPPTSGGDLAILLSRWGNWLRADPAWHPKMDPDVRQMRPAEPDCEWWAWRV